MLNKLKEFLLSGVNGLPDLYWWNSLDVDYFPPRVERLWIQKGEYRYYLHKIYKTDEPCLLHKHRWPSAIFVLEGAYEMGVSHLENELIYNDKNELINPPPLNAKILMNKGSAYEMLQTNGIHYVKPITEYSLSVMVTGPLYKEKRVEKLDRELKGLSSVDAGCLRDWCQLHWPKRSEINKILL